MSSKRKQSIKREGARKFIPDCEPCYTYVGKVLTNDYDRECFLQGWNKEKHEHESSMRREAEERAIYD